MIIFDIFYVVIYNFLNYKLRRGKDNAKLSALSFVVIWLTLFITVISNVIGLLNNNTISHYIVNNFFFAYVLIGIILFLIFGLRYYKRYDVEYFQEIFYQKSKQKQILYNCLVPFIMVLILVLDFCTFRLYEFGHI